MENAQHTPYSRLNRWKDVTSDDIRIVLAILINMGLVQKPSYEDHWSTNIFLESTGIPKFMSRDRFEIILAHLHFYDGSSDVGAGTPHQTNVADEATRQADLGPGQEDYVAPRQADQFMAPTEADEAPRQADEAPRQAEDAPQQAEKQDKLRKIRPLIQLVNERLSSVYTPEKDLSIDESLVKFKGRLGIKQYIPAKRSRFGIKLFVLCESSGYVWKVEVYQGKNTIDGKSGSIQSLLALACNFTK